MVIGTPRAPVTPDVQRRRHLRVAVIEARQRRHIEMLSVAHRSTSAAVSTAHLAHPRPDFIQLVRRIAAMSKMRQRGPATTGKSTGLRLPGAPSSPPRPPSPHWSRCPRYTHRAACRRTRRSTAPTVPSHSGRDGIDSIKLSSSSPTPAPTHGAPNSAAAVAHSSRDNPPAHTAARPYRPRAKPARPTAPRCRRTVAAQGFDEIIIRSFP